MSYKVKEVADMVGVSIRTLHYYDQIGLLKPESTSSAGYRLYTDRDLEKLQQILFFRELGFGLKETKKIISDQGFDRSQALLAHREMLLAKKQRLDELILTVQKTLAATEGERKMNNREMFGAFDMAIIEKHKARYAAEVRQKYGQAYEESERRTVKYTAQDWAAIMHKGGEIYQKLAALMDKPPHAPEVQAAIGEWRKHISDYFYPCTLEIFRGLSNLYADDKRFTANIDKVKTGLAEFMRKAVLIYCDKAEQAQAAPQA